MEIRNIRLFCSAGTQRLTAATLSELLVEANGNSSHCSFWLHECEVPQPALRLRRLRVLSSGWSHSMA